MATKGKDLALAKKIYDIIDQRRGEGTAISVSFVKDNEVLAAAAAGTLDGDPKRPASTEDLYNIGSVSKTYVAMAVLKCVELGLCELDAPVYKYVPKFRMVDERYKQITLRMCINHSSGLPGTGWNGSFCTAYYSAQKFYDSFLDYLSHCDLKCDPGEYSVYCNDGFTLAEIAVVTLSGMPYTAFVQKYITGPLGCVSTCSGANDPDHRALVAQKGMPREYLMVLGSGGISTDISDCAKYGWAFIEPGAAFTKEQADLTAELQPVKRGVAGFARGFGLGWDLVNFKGIGIDLGDDTLMKSGGTLEFLTYLVASKKYRLSGAVSMTQDIKLDPLALLCELFALALGEEFKKPEPKTEGQPLPEGFAEKWSGIYYAPLAKYEACFNDNKLTVKTLSPAGTKEMFKDLPYVDGRFPTPGPAIVFVEDPNGKKFISQDAGYIMGTLGQKDPSYPPVNEAWLRRNGKTYIVKDIVACDAVPAMLGIGAKLIADPEKGVVSLAVNYAGTVATSPALVKDDTHLSQFLEARDTYSSSLWVEDGFEHMHSAFGELVEAAWVPQIAEGKYKIAAGETFHLRIPAGRTYAVEYGSARAISADADLNVTGDSLFRGPVTKVGEGFLIICADEDTTLTVKAE